MFFICVFAEARGAFLVKLWRRIFAGVARDANHSDNDRKSHFFSLFLFSQKSFATRKPTHISMNHEYVGAERNFQFHPHNTQFCMNIMIHTNRRSVADVFWRSLNCNKKMVLCVRRVYCHALSAMVEFATEIGRKTIRNWNSLVFFYLFFPIRWKAAIIHCEDTSHTCHMESICMDHNDHPYQSMHTSNANSTPIRSRLEPSSNNSSAHEKSIIGFDFKRSEADIYFRLTFCSHTTSATRNGVKCSGDAQSTHVVSRTQTIRTFHRHMFPSFYCRISMKWNGKTIFVIRLLHVRGSYVQFVRMAITI